MKSALKWVSWLAIPNIGILIVTLQALGLMMVLLDPSWVLRLALIPSMVADEPWRLITFLSLPLSVSPIFALLTLWFLYFVLNVIETQWGSLRTTLYVLTSIMATIVFSLLLGYPVTSVSYFESTLFLAAAMLMPEMEISLFGIVPVKMKWLAWLSFFFVGRDLLFSDWLGRGYILAMYSNFILFFGPNVLASLKNAQRRRRYRRGLRP